MHRPQTLTDAFALAKLQEATISSFMRKPKPLLDKPFVKTSFGHSYTQKFAPASGFNQGHRPVMGQNQKLTTSRLSEKEVAERRAKNLCFTCNEKWTPTHKCKAQLHSIEIVSVEEDEQHTETSDEWSEEGQTYCSNDDIPPLISLNAITGNTTYQTMRVSGKVRGNTLHILID
ncbi:hypothetical protein RND81_10G076000 [Saponaria officinalis]|uniref:Uncharacterized protein n=1 Tax=Saponaria officinalis TaxID=3572 RepID=A0AAW1I1W0_SAPOF